MILTCDTSLVNGCPGYRLIIDDYRIIGFLTDEDYKEPLITAFNEYQALKEENEKLKKELKIWKHFDQDSIEFDIAQQQRDELVEMLQEMFQADDKLLIHKWIYDNRDRVQLLLNKIKESANIKEG
jgi:hypothetical protein